MNKENTVVLPLRRYNELRDLEKSLHENKFTIYHKDSYYSSSYYEYLSKEQFKDVVVKVHKADVKLFESEKNNLKNEIDLLKEELKKEKSKRRSWWN